MWPLVLVAAAALAIWQWKRSRPAPATGNCAPATTLTSGHQYNFAVMVTGAPYADPTGFATSLQQQLASSGAWQGVSVGVWGDPSAPAFAWPPPAPDAGTAVIVIGKYMGAGGPAPASYVGLLDCGTGGATPGS